MSDDHSNSASESEAEPVAGNQEPNGPSSATTTPAKKTPSKKTPSKSPATSSPKVSYIQLVTDAIVAMNDRTGSSKIAIEKYIMANNPNVEAKRLKQRLLLTLKTGVANKRFVKVKASFKIHPDRKKKKKKKKAVKTPPPKKQLTKEQLAAQREKERQRVKEKERLDRIRRRKFPMDDLELIQEDKELKVSVSLATRPTLPVVFPNLSAGCSKSDSMGSGLFDDILHVYHFFRGDVGWGRLGKNKDVVAPFTLHQLMKSFEQVSKGTAKKTRMVPPLISHLFVVTLQHLVPEELQVALKPSSWSEVLMMYMDAMERFYTSEASLNKNALPGLAIDTEYLFCVTDERKQKDELEPQTTRTSPFYLHGHLEKIHAKLFTNDPWMLSADELLALLKALVDDMLATQPEISDHLDVRLHETYEMFKRKRAADAHLRKLQTTRNKEQNEEKEKQETDEKATRSNTKLPTVSDAQIDSAKRAQLRATDAYEKACRSQIIRTGCIGEDRNCNSVYHFFNDPERVYIAVRGKNNPSQTTYKLPGLENYRTTWHVIDKKSVLVQYMESLDVRGKRELALHDALKPALRSVEDDIKALNDQKALLKEKQEVQRRLENAKLKCEFGRKSGRLAAQSEQEFLDLQSEIDHLESAIAGQGEPLKPRLEVETGLQMLRDFDRQEEQSQRRRATRRDVHREKTEEGQLNKLPRLQCSRMWSTGNIDGTGTVGAIVWKLLELEERVERLGSWSSGDRKAWIANLETAAHSWHISSPPDFEEDSNAGPISSPILNSKPKETDGSPASLTSPASVQSGSTPSVSQILSMLKNPLLELEARLFELSGLGMASRDADEADDNMSTSPDETKELDQQVLWKKVVHRMHRLPAKAHSKIRQAVVEAIAAARKAHQPAIVAQLREALLQFHPDAAGACKTLALEILEQHGGYDDSEDDEDEDENMEENEDDPKDEGQHQELTGLSSVLCAEAVILNSSLDGREDASRQDWISATKKAKTVSKIAALATAFYMKAVERLEKLENEKQSLEESVEAWEKAKTLRKKKTSNESIPEPSEVWAHATFTDEFCLAKVEDYPWWPAKKCVPVDKLLASSLESLGRTLVSLVGESGGLRVVKTEDLLPFSETLPEQEDMSREMRTQLDDCMTMARRVIRGKQKKLASKSRKRKSSGYSEFKEEKKLAT